jgi:hypothetical protein
VTQLELFYCWGYVWLFSIVKGIYVAYKNLLQNKEKEVLIVSYTQETDSLIPLILKMLWDMVRQRGFYNLLWVTIGLFTPLWGYFVFIWITFLPTILINKMETPISTIRINYILAGIIKIIAISAILHHGGVGIYQFI